MRFIYERDLPIAFYKVQGGIEMTIKKKFGMGVLSAALGLTLITGGTYAYFSSTAVTENTFAAGTLDLSVEPDVIVDIDNLKPGDTFIRDFELHNNGTLDIERVLLETKYTVIDANNDNTNDFGEHIKVEFLYNADQFNEVVYETTLAELKDLTPEAVGENIFGEQEGLEVGVQNDLVVKFHFVDNGEDQNQFQGDSLRLTWTFVAEQTAGEAK